MAPNTRAAARGRAPSSAWLSRNTHPISPPKQGKSSMQNNKVRELANFIWNTADTLRGKFKAHDYGKVILPFFVLRRLDCLLAETQEATIEMADTLPEGIDEDTRDLLLFDVANAGKVYNLSPLTFSRIKGQNPSDLHDNLVAYITGFSANMRDIFIDKFKFLEQLKELKDHGILWDVFEQFTDVNLSPAEVSNLEMGYVFEELIRRFSEQANETAGEHFTPREVVHLIVDLLIANDRALTGRGLIRTVYDPACGTGGILSIAEAEIKAINEGVRVELYGQEQNKESYAICRSDMLVTGHDPEQIAFGDTLANDQHRGQRFHWMMSNPPYGVDWKASAEAVKDEAKELGYDGRFGAGLPQIGDGQLLFLQHMVAKMRDDEQGSQIGIVMNGSPMFTGAANSGESEIRRWLLEKDLVTAIVSLPTDLFYNTGIQTFVWILTNRKEEKRKGHVQLIDGSSFWQKMRKSLGMKRREISSTDREALVSLFYEGKPMDIITGYEADGREAFREIVAPEWPTLEAPKGGRVKRAPVSLVLPNEAFGYRAVTIERPKIDDKGRPVRGTRGSSKGNFVADPQLRETANIPLTEDVEAYLDREVRPHAPHAWVDEKKTRVGYEIPFNQHFYVFDESRALEEIDADLAKVTAKIQDLLRTPEGQEPSADPVTKGANPAASYRSSGISWAGEIPSHWGTCTIGKVARLESGHTPSKSKPEYWVEEECVIPWVTTGDVKRFRDGREIYIDDTAVRISEVGLANSSARLLPAGTVFLSRTASVGFSGIMSTDMAVSQDFAAWVCGERLLPEYLLLCLRAMKQEFARLMMGSTHKTIYMPDIKKLAIPLPPIEEQKMIVEHVLGQKKRAERLIDCARINIELLHERRDALNAAAVTGRLNVHDGDATKTGEAA